MKDSSDGIFESEKLNWINCDVMGTFACEESKSIKALATVSDSRASKVHSMRLTPLDGSGWRNRLQFVELYSVARTLQETAPGST